MLSILIVNWKTRDLLRECLASIREHCAALSHETIVVENASADGSSDMVAREFPEVRLLANTHNNGFAGGNNQAYENARGNWIWLLNPDTRVLAGAPQPLIHWLETHPRCGGVASALVDARTGKNQSSCRTFPTPAALWAQASGLATAFPRSRRFGFYKMGHWNSNRAQRVEQPMASSFLLRRTAIENSGGLFDERFPIFFNDVDLCWRLHRAGWEIWYLPQARVVHHGGASTRQRKAAMIEESHQSLRRFYELHWRGEYSPLLFRATLWMSDLAGAARVRLASRRD